MDAMKTFAEVQEMAAKIAATVADSARPHVRVAEVYERCRIGVGKPHLRVIAGRWTIFDCPRETIDCASFRIAAVHCRRPVSEPRGAKP